jgi:hypothetical protein
MNVIPLLLLLLKPTTIYTTRVYRGGGRISN